MRSELSEVAPPGRLLICPNHASQLLTWSSAGQYRMVLDSSRTVAGQYRTVGSVGTVRDTDEAVARVRFIVDKHQIKHMEGRL